MLLSVSKPQSYNRLHHPDFAVSTLDWNSRREGLLEVVAEDLGTCMPQPNFPSWHSVHALVSALLRIQDGQKTSKHPSIICVPSSVQVVSQ